MDIDDDPFGTLPLLLRRKDFDELAAELTERRTALRAYTRDHGGTRSSMREHRRIDVLQRALLRLLP